MATAGLLCSESNQIESNRSSHGRFETPCSIIICTARENGTVPRENGVQAMRNLRCLACITDRLAMVATKNKPHPLSPGSTKSNTAAKQKSNNNSKKKRGYCSTPPRKYRLEPVTGVGCTVRP
mmetsp:Transcript_45114/g.48810  ORF Transcript_45114/g.48810 Transcript_45114/m.48810 type:complete len:123 (+) Transcript_45114:434-802(+)